MFIFTNDFVSMNVEKRHFKNVEAKLLKTPSSWFASQPLNMSHAISQSTLRVTFHC